ncbi:MAG: carbohydrate-binding domain-containing protein, partial [Clostridia bacterium]|nr:carbohydrate-binding domain-containing protein [Clostridia bacterium]
MKKLRRAISLLLIAVLMLSLCPPLSAATSEVRCTLIGNSGAVFTLPAGVTLSTDSDLVGISTANGKTYVTAVSGAVGVAEVSLSNGCIYEIPVGYTTFAFNGDCLTVYEGSDTKYEIAGINAANEEYLEGDATYPLPVYYDADGNAVYRNTDTYKINVGIKKKGGTYVFYGNSDDMTVCVKKEATAEAHLYLAGLNLSSSFTSPITVKKDSTTTAYITALNGFYNTLTDCEFNNADIYGDTADGGDGTNAEYAESSCIKGKDYANVVVNGKGTLELNCVTKNAVKVNEYGSLTIEDVTLVVNSVKHGISSDNTLTVNSGNMIVNAAEDGIRCDPTAVDATLGCASLMTVNGGYINVNSGYDAIQSAQDIYINGGIFNITAGGGYNSSAFDKDTMSCKGIKASYNGEDEDTVDTSTLTQHIQITDGIFKLDTADDSVHSDAYITITGGDFDIATSDDGIHSDTTLILGEEGGDNSKVRVNISTCYEGIESGTVNFYSGTYDVLATNDGVNSAGGSDSSSDTGTGGGFNPGGGRPGHNNNNSGGTASAGSFALNVYGGDLFVNVSNGDGLDSNGTLTLSGGNIEVWGAPTGQDGEPVDGDGTKTISGATVFGAGNSMMSSSYSGSQTVKTSNTSISAGKTINVKNGSTTVFNRTALKKVSYVLYSSPATTSSWTISADSSALIDSHTHSYTKTADISATCISNGMISYACTGCNAVYTETVAALGHRMGSYLSDDNESDYVTASESAYCTNGCGKFVSVAGELKEIVEVHTHSYTAVTTDPTCTDDGNIIYTCSCGDSYTESIAALGHSYTATTTIATCTEAGYTTYTCSVCEDTYIADEIAALGHSFGAWVETKAPTTTEVGIETRTCTVCGATETQDIPMLSADAPIVAGVYNYTVTLNGINNIKEIRFALGTYTTGAQVKAAEKNVTLDAATAKKYTVDGTFSYEVPWVGTYTFWVRTNDGSQYFLYTDVNDITPYAESYGVKLTVKDFGENYKDLWIAEGTFNSYAEIKASTAFKYQASAVKLANYFATHDFSYTVTNPGAYTILVRYNDGSFDVVHTTLTVDVPVFVENGLQVTVQNIPDVKIIRTAYGHYTTVAQIKSATGVRNFNNKTAIKNAEEYMIQYREEGEVTLIVEYNNGYKHFHYYNVAKKVPTFVQDGNKVTIGDLDDLYIVRYAPGKYTTSNAIKAAAGSKYLKSADINVNGELVIENLTSGRWSFMVQYN